MKDYLDHPDIAAVYIGGSRASQTNDENSDIDVYVLTTGPIGLDWRRAFIASRNPTKATIAPGHFGDGDAWVEAGTDYDVMFWNVGDTVADLRRLLIDCVPSSGYTTAFWHTIRHWQEIGRAPGHDEVLDELAELASRRYPDRLAEAIIDNNRILLRGVMFSLEDQILTAARRGDTISLNHRSAAIIASWTDIVFAANRRTHPGEKRLADHIAQLPSVPAQWRQDISALISADPTSAPAVCQGLIDRLESWLDSPRAGS